MSSRLVALFRMIAYRAARTINRPNSWAVVSQWRRLYEIEQQQEEMVAQIVDEHLGPEIRPIQNYSEFRRRQTILGHADLVQDAASSSRHEGVTRRQMEQPDSRVQASQVDPRYLPQ